MEFNLGHVGTGGKLYFHEYLQKKIQIPYDDIHDDDIHDDDIHDDDIHHFWWFYNLVMD